MARSGDATRKSILDAANLIVQERGTEHLTLELTAQIAGISKGGLLYHFPTKEDLIKGMIQYYLERFTADFNAVAKKEEATTPGRWTRSYLSTTYEDSQRNPRMSSGLLAAVASDPNLLEPMQQAFTSWVNLLEKDGIDPTTAMIVRLAVDGLWMVDLFGLAAPGPELREKIYTTLLNMSKSDSKI